MTASLYVLRFWKITSALIIVLLALTVVTPVFSETASASDSATNQITVYFFYGNGCPHCALVEPLIDSLAVKYPQVSFLRLEVWYDSANKALYDQFNAQYGVQNPVVPEVFVGGQVLIAEVAIENNLEPIIQSLINSNNTPIPPSGVTPSSPSNNTPSTGTGDSSSENPLPPTNPSPSTDTIDDNEATQTAPHMSAVINTPTSGIEYNNTPASTSNSQSAAAGASTSNSVEGMEPASEVSVLETIPPEVNFVTADGSIFNSSQVVISWNYTIGQSDVATAEVAIENGSFSSIDANATSYVASGLSNGNHTFTLRITDKSGLSANHSLNFTVNSASKSLSSAQVSSSSLLWNPLLVCFAAFILIVGLSLMLVQRMRRKV